MGQKQGKEGKQIVSADKDDQKSEPKAEPKAHPQVEQKAEPKVEPKSDLKSDANADHKLELKTEPKLEAKAELETDLAQSKHEPKNEPKLTMDSQIPPSKSEESTRPASDTMISPSSSRSPQSALDCNVSIVAKYLLHLQSAQRPATTEKLSNFIKRRSCFTQEFPLGVLVKLLMQEADASSTLGKALETWLVALKRDSVDHDVSIDDALAKKRVAECLGRLRSLGNAWESMSFTAQHKWLEASAVVSHRLSPNQIVDQLKASQIITCDSNLRIAYNEESLQRAANDFEHRRDATKTTDYVSIQKMSVSIGHGMGAKVRAEKLGAAEAAGFRWCLHALGTCKIEKARLRYQFHAKFRPKGKGNSKGKGKGKGKGKSTPAAPVDNERQIEFTCQLLASPEESIIFKDAVLTEATKELDGILGEALLVSECTLPEEKALEASILSLQSYFKCYIEANSTAGELKIWFLDSSIAQPEMVPILQLLFARKPSFTLEYDAGDTEGAHQVLAACKRLAYAHNVRIDVQSKKSKGEILAWPSPWMLKQGETASTLQEKMKRAEQALNSAEKYAALYVEQAHQEALEDDETAWVPGADTEVEKVERAKQHYNAHNRGNWSAKKATQERRALERQFPGMSSAEARAGTARRAEAKVQIRREKDKHIDQKRSHNRDAKTEERDHGIGEERNTNFR